MMLSPHPRTFLMGSSDLVDHLQLPPLHHSTTSPLHHFTTPLFNEAHYHTRLFDSTSLFAPTRVPSHLQDSPLSTLSIHSFLSAEPSISHRLLRVPCDTFFLLDPLTVLALGLVKDPGLPIYQAYTPCTLPPDPPRIHQFALPYGRAHEISRTLTLISRLHSGLLAHVGLLSMQITIPIALTHFHSLRRGPGLHSGMRDLDLSFPPLGPQL